MATTTEGIGMLPGPSAPTEFDPNGFHHDTVSDELDIRRAIAARIRETWIAQGRPAQHLFADIIGLTRSKANMVLNERVERIGLETLVTCGERCGMMADILEKEAPDAAVVSPWQEGEPPDMRLRRQLAEILKMRLKILKMTQEEAADCFGLTRPLISGAVSGSNLKGISSKLLLRYVRSLGATPVIRVQRLS